MNIYKYIYIYIICCRDIEEAIDYPSLFTRCMSLDRAGVETLSFQIIS